MKYFKQALLAIVMTFTVAGAGAQNQTISLGATTMTARELIATIESRTGFRFSYNKSMFDISRRITLPAASMPLKAVLDKMTAGTDTRYVIRDRFIAFVPAEDNSRPQVRGSEALTSDAYTPGERVVYVAGKREPVVETPASEPLAVVVDDADAEQEPLSSYTPVEISHGVQRALPRFAFKTNLLYLATTTPNIAFEFGMARRWTMELAYSNNPWNYKANLDSNRKLLHGIARVEARYWFCERFNGHFLGVHALYSEYNVAGVDVPLLFKKGHRYHGNAWGGGLDYGYDLPIAKRWNVEFTVGVGIYRMRYDRYSCMTCDRNGTPHKQTWIGPSRLGVSFMFLLK